MLTLSIAVALTLSISAVCSLLEAMILSTTPTDIESLKKTNPVKGAQLEEVRVDIEETISSILTLNTMANTLGAVLVGGIATKLFGEVWLGVISGAMGLSILIFSEVLPKNIGVHYRRALQPFAVAPLRLIRMSLRPFTFLVSRLIVSVLGKKVDQEGEAGTEIILMAQKGAQDGDLDRAEVNLIANSLSLASVKLHELMTPRTVVICVSESERLSEVLARLGSIRFGRMPVHTNSPDEIIGVVRRRDVLHALAANDGGKLIKEIKRDAVFFPETASASSALETLLTGNQQLGIVVDEFGSFVGVITIEDIVEHLIGKEIYEKDDVAVDMRQLARLKSKLAGINS